MQNEKDSLNMSSIVEDFLMINNEIISAEKKIDNIYFLYLYKLFVVSRRKKKLRNILKNIEKCKDYYILTKEDVSELSNNIYASFMPEGSFKNIKFVEFISNDEHFLKRIMVEVDSIIKALIKHNVNTNEMIIEFSINTINNENKNEFKHFSFTVADKLSTDNNSIKEYVDTLNKTLINVLIDYMYFVLDNF